MIFVVAIIIIAAVSAGVTYLAVKPAPEAGMLEASNLSIPGINAGQDAVITLDVKNKGESENTWSLYLKVEGVVVATTSVTLGPGESKTIQLTAPEVMVDSRVEIAGLTGTIDVTPIFKIAVVSDVGGRGDLSFNDMGFKGGEEAMRDFGVEMMELISKTEADYTANLRTAAQDPNVKLIVGVGYLLSSALASAAGEFPDKNFVGIDTFASAISPHPNLMDVVYEEHKGSAVVGALGGLLAAYYSTGTEVGENNFPYIGVVLGIEISVLWKFEIGYKWGCDWAMSWIENNKPDMKRGIYNTPRKERVLWTYTGTFDDITKGYLAAQPMYVKGAVAVYNVAGPLGRGINSAVKDIALRDKLTTGPPFWIGVDADQDWINPGFCIASMMKRVDRGVYYTTKMVKENTFRQAVTQYGGWLTLGIGTSIMGVPVEGISVSTLADLDEFIAMGVRAEEMTGEPILPGPPAWIKEKAKELRDNQPAWIWSAVAELENKIASGAIVVPLADTKGAVDNWRAILG